MLPVRRRSWGWSEAMRSRGRADVALFLALSALFAAAGAWFVWPALVACHAFPAPLDDVYIHANFARATAHGHPFEWIAGQGYSSGETAPLYPFLLAPALLVGIDDEKIVAWAFAVGCTSLGFAATKVTSLARGGSARGFWNAIGIAIGTALVWVSIGTLDFTFFSGMEAAAFFGAAAAGLAAAEDARSRVEARASATRRVGAWGAAMVLLRPEGIVIVVLFALMAARGARTRSAGKAFLRAAMPGALATLIVLAQNSVMTGDFMSAGARLKLLGSNPYLDDVTRAKELVLNLLSFHWKVLLADIGPFGLAALGGLALAGVIAKPTRHAAGSCVLGAVAFALLVSTNGAARYQGFRYYAPAVALFTIASALGASAFGRALGGRFRVAGPVVLVGIALNCAPRTAEARRFFTRASSNVHGQQVTMGKKIARDLPRDAVVMVGDAGAIPFFSRRSSVDALGLGGYMRRPFVRAAVHGESATLELVEHLPKGARPSHLALYPNWFPLTTSLFGHEIGRVTIEDNVICGGPTKVLYEARFETLGEGDAVDLGFPPPGLGAPVDACDFADVESEADHLTVLPVPNGGYTVGKVARPGAGLGPKFDGGRIVPPRREISFIARHLGPRRARTLVVRGDDQGFDVDVVTEAGGCDRLAAVPMPGAFTHARCIVSVGDGDAVTLRAREWEARLFHGWIGTP